MKMETTFSNDTYSSVIAFETDDFPKKELLVLNNKVVLPSNYEGESSDPFLVDAFNAAIRAGNLNALFTKKITFIQSTFESPPSMAYSVFRRFLLPTSLIQAIDSSAIKWSLFTNEFGVTDEQVFLYLTTELFEGTILRKTVEMEDLKLRADADYLEGLPEYFNVLQYMLDVKVLPSKTEMRKYRQLVYILEYRLWNHSRLVDILAYHNLKIWELSQQFSEEALEAFHNKMWNINVPDELNNMHTWIVLLQTYLVTPEIFEALESTPENWFWKLIK